jgi:hypothetical protein
VLSGNPSGYVLGVLDGIDGEAGIVFPSQVCAVLPCPTPGRNCLSYQQPLGQLQGLVLQMSGVESSTLVPEVVATKGGYSQVELTPGDETDGFTFRKSHSTSELHISTTMNVFSALIYGRLFDKDHLPYSCGSGSSSRALSTETEELYIV